jgi:hypothetical protein
MLDHSFHVRDSTPTKTGFTLGLRKRRESVGGSADEDADIISIS